MDVITPGPALAGVAGVCLLGVTSEPVGGCGPGSGEVSVNCWFPGVSCCSLGTPGCVAGAGAVGGPSSEWWRARKGLVRVRGEPRRPPVSAAGG